jgi:hydroxymethylpyrimidine pyrophosphatase-like HAD family hydrolase
MKDFELSYKFVPNNYNFVNIDEYDSDSDIIYTNVINENYVTEFDEIELKVNTAAENKPISRSYIMDSSSDYIVNLTKNGVTKRQEHNLVNMYYDHFNSPKKIYECTIHDYLNPGSPV